MPYLLDTQCIPFTFSWGFVEAPLPEACSAFLEWNDGHATKIVSEQVVNGSLPEVLRKLEPATFPYCRYLWLETHSSWTAYFNNGRIGSEAWMAIDTVCEKRKCRGVTVDAVPEQCGGAVGFALYGPEEGEWLNLVRGIEVARDARWEFHTIGDPLPFEQTTRYAARRVRERFTTEMLDDYCAALGIRVFDPAFYGPNGIIFLEDEKYVSPDSRQTIEDVQREYGLIP